MVLNHAARWSSTDALGWAVEHGKDTSTPGHVTKKGALFMLEQQLQIISVKNVFLYLITLAVVVLPSL